MAKFPIVGIGSSAGGLEALQKLFGAMPADGGLGFIVAAHLDPTQKSHLAELLAQCTAMPVAQIERSVEVRPDHVYVIAPDQELTIRDGVVHANRPAAPRGHRHPVDSFFRSLAEDQGERAIAIVLSGTGNNGSVGLRFIKAEGGIALAQDPESAGFDGMPRSAIDTGIVDLILPPEQMPEALLRLARHPYVREPDRPFEDAAPDEQLAVVLGVVRAATRQAFGGYRKRTLLRRIYRRMGLHQIESLSTYAERLRTNSAEVKALAADLTINVTGFFRDPQAWDTLAAKVIAPLVRERPANSTIRVWVPGCSTGEEAYSLAMLIAEQAQAAHKNLEIRLFATDVAGGVLPSARSGIYPESVAADVGEERLKRFFAIEDGAYAVTRTLREMVTFAPQNLLQDPPFSRLDLISCRNLLIYLKPEFQARVLRLFHFALREGGHLFLGPSETISGQEDMFDPVSRKWRIFRRVGPTRHDLVDFPLPDHGDATRGDGTDVPSADPEPDPGTLMDKALLARYAPATALVDPAYRVHYLRGPTDAYLRSPSGEPSYNLLAMAREGLRAPLRRAVRRAHDEGQEVAVEARVRRRTGQRPVRIVVTPVDTARNAPARLLIGFFEATADAPPVEPEPQVGGERQLQEELDTTREDLRLSIEQAEASNEELKASNEEIRSINEELQASNEELETSKEELQALNEELNTVNSQLQAKVAELERRTDDLDNLLSSTDVATLFLDRSLCIRWFTPSTRPLLELRPTDIGRPIAHFAQRFSGGALVEDARQVLERLVPSSCEVMDDLGRWYIRRILPYRTAADRIEGVVVTFIEITERRQAEDALRRNEERLRKVLDTDTMGFLFLDKEGTLIDANDAFLRMTGYSRSDVESRELTWRKMTPPEWIEISEEQMERLEETGRSGPYEKEYVHKDGSRSWMLFAGTKLEDGTIVKYCMDISDRKRVEDERALLARELSHRVKNTLAVVQALAMQTHVREGSIDAYREAFVGRLQAMARAHDLLLEAQWCQSALNVDPVSASKIDPLGTAFDGSFGWFDDEEGCCRWGWDHGVNARVDPMIPALGATGLCRLGQGGEAMISSAVLEAPAFVAGLDDVAVVGQAIEQRGGHLGVTEDAWPFAEVEIGGDDHRGLLVEMADQMEQKLAAGLGKRQVAELIQDDEVQPREPIGDPALPVGPDLGLELVDQIDHVEEPTTGAVADTGPGDRYGEMRLTRAGSADQHAVALMAEEVAAGEVAHQGLIDRRAFEHKVVHVLRQRQLGDGHLIFDRARLLLRDLGGEQVADDPLRLVLTLNGGGQDLVIGGLHAVELEAAHGAENCGTFHQTALLRRS